MGTYLEPNKRTAAGNNWISIRITKMRLHALGDCAKPNLLTMAGDPLEIQRCTGDPLDPLASARYALSGNAECKWQRNALQCMQCLQCMQNATRPCRRPRDWPDWQATAAMYAHETQSPQVQPGRLAGDLCVCLLMMLDYHMLPLLLPCCHACLHYSSIRSAPETLQTHA